MFSLGGVGPIVCFHGNINASVYKELLRRHVLPRIRKGIVETPIFMQDNALGFLEDEGIAVMKWPPLCSDMNPLENLWKS